MMALPAWWLGHLALLGRPVADAGSSGNGAAPVAPAWNGIRSAASCSGSPALPF